MSLVNLARLGLSQTFGGYVPKCATQITLVSGASRGVGEAKPASRLLSAGRDQFLEARLQARCDCGGKPLWEVGGQVGKGLVECFSSLRVDLVEQALNGFSGEPRLCASFNEMVPEHSLTL